MIWNYGLMRAAGQQKFAKWQQHSIRRHFGYRGSCRALNE